MEVSRFSNFRLWNLPSGRDRCRAEPDGETEDRVQLVASRRRRSEQVEKWRSGEVEQSKRAKIFLSELSKFALVVVVVVVLSVVSVGVDVLLWPNSHQKLDTSQWKKD